MTFLALVVLGGALGFVTIEWRYWRRIAQAQEAYIVGVDALLKESLQQTAEALERLGV